MCFRMFVADWSGVSHILFMPTTCPHSLQIIKVPPATSLVVVYIPKGYASFGGRCGGIGTPPKEEAHKLKVRPIALIPKNVMYAVATMFRMGRDNTGTTLMCCACTHTERIWEFALYPFLMSRSPSYRFGCHKSWNRRFRNSWPTNSERQNMVSKNTLTRNQTILYAAKHKGGNRIDFEDSAEHISRDLVIPG
jgi:hypothetical protein